MTLKRVTMQEIADACGLSRNTVSKVFNGRGSVPESTKRMVINKARQLGYYQYSIADTVGGRHNGNIALLTQQKLLSHSFGTYFFTGFTNQISQYGYSIQMHEVSREELADKRLPASLNTEQTTAILGIELFDRDYIDMVCSLKIPTVFVDGYVRAGKSLLQCDYISMENVTSETAIVNHAISRGAKRLGFVGDIDHCNSFYERWLGFCSALGEFGIPVDRDCCILAKDGDYYGDTAWLLRQLAGLPYMPDAFACANDFLAIRLMAALKKMGLSIPGDIMVTGFGGSPESTVVEPALTTARIPSNDIGRLAASILTKRVQQPDFPYQWTYVMTTPIWRDSTR